MVKPVISLLNTRERYSPPHHAGSFIRASARGAVNTHKMYLVGYHGDVGHRIIAERRRVSPPPT